MGRKRASRRTRRRRTLRNRKQRGGQARLAFYTCYFGPDKPESGFMVPQAFENYDCYYFTNNQTMQEKLRGTKWKTVFVNTPIKATARDNSMDAKEVKACPHHFKELEPYAYLCYFDSKLTINQKDVEALMKVLDGSKYVFAIGKHQFIKDTMAEFEEGMKHDRYKQDEAKYKALIDKKVKEGFGLTPKYHHQTGFILRKKSDTTNKINEEWYADILATGPECQISFPFTYLKYQEFIFTVDAYGTDGHLRLCKPMNSEGKFNDEDIAESDRIPRC